MLAVVTIGPIAWRPISPLPTQLERGVALAAVAFAFSLAYPRRLAVVVALVLGATALFEILQLVEPSRHGRVADLAAKLAGANVGFALGWLLVRLRKK